MKIINISGEIGSDVMPDLKRDIKNLCKDIKNGKNTN